jgi:hypothetical protein
LTDAQIDQVRELLAQERAETERRIAEAQLEFLQQVTKVLDDIDDALARCSKKFDHIAERQHRLDAEIAEVRTLTNAENATIIDGTPMPSRRTRDVN